MLSKAFWILAALEFAILAWLYKGTLNMETQSGGRDITQFIYVGMPGAILLFASLLFAFSTSRVPRSLAMAIILVPPVMLVYNQARHNLLVRAATSSVAHGWSASSLHQSVMSAFILVPPFLLGHTRAKGLLNDVQLDALALEHFRDAGQRALGQAIVTRQVALVKQLAGKTRLNEIDDENRQTLLDVALRQQGPETPEIVEVLLAAGANPNLIPEKARSTPLIQAIRSGRPEIFTALLHHGADPNSRTRSGDVSYHSAFDAYGGESSKYLIQALDHGADTNAVNSESKTALILAAISEDTEAINILVDRGADVTRVDAAGKTALEYLEAGISRSAQSSNDVTEAKRAAQRLRIGK